MLKRSRQRINWEGTRPLPCWNKGRKCRTSVQSESQKYDCMPAWCRENSEGLWILAGACGLCLRAIKILCVCCSSLSGSSPFEVGCQDSASFFSLRWPVVARRMRTLENDGVRSAERKENIKRSLTLADSACLLQGSSTAEEPPLGSPSGPPFNTTHTHLSIAKHIIGWHCIGSCLFPPFPKSEKTLSFAFFAFFRL